MYKVRQLFIYPIKSLAGFEVALAMLTDRGFQHDRRWMLVDSSNVFITQRQYPEMCLLQTAIENDELIVFHKNNPEDQLRLALQPAPTSTFKVKIWDDECEAQAVGDAASKWFSNKLSTQCKLVYMPDGTRRKVDGLFAFNNELNNFSDAYPLHIIGQASLDDLNSRLQATLPINRFRPNIFFEGGSAYDEDIMQEVLIGNIKMLGVKLCARCPITTINQANADKAKEPLKTLAGYRMKNNKVYFGQNLLHTQTGQVNVGDAIEILKRKEPALFNTIVAEDKNRP
ncbi:MAG: MOSC N-terminal beta barrel domain-containing protein [Aquabacterium sp.]|nr:MOSC N-terminal beta barrel domain-containing protein [Ferruginibacter sp.]